MRRPLRARGRAATLACGQGAVASHELAAALWGISGATEDVALHVTVAERDPGSKPVISRAGHPRAPILRAILGLESASGC